MFILNTLGRLSKIRFIVVIAGVMCGQIYAQNNDSLRSQKADNKGIIKFRRDSLLNASKLIKAELEKARESPSDSARRGATKFVFGSGENREMLGTQITHKMDSLLNPELRIGGYISTYFAYYDDETETNDFVQFPTLEPRRDQFSLNMALINMQYRSHDMRANLALHYGDVPACAWPTTFNLIQEANAGFRVYKKWWLDAGFFKTHIGLESFQPRENLTSSMSIPNLFDPYYFSGIKLTYVANSKLNLQVCVFNGYNEYIEDNRNKAFDFSLNYNPTDNISFTYNFLTCDETLDNVKTKHQRYYQNAYATFIYHKFTLGLDANLGFQQNSLLGDTTRVGIVYGGTIVGKYNVATRFNVYGRLEDFSDPNRILTGSMKTGNYVCGTTLGFQITPRKNIAFSTEWRILQSDALIFRQGNTALNQRNEVNVCLDLWF